MLKSMVSSFLMRWHTEKPENWTNYYGQTYRCEHPVYSSATLYLEGSKGLCVIQQRFNSRTKATFWGPIDPWLCDELYLRYGFSQFFRERAGKKSETGLYPSVTIRQIMWALRMKPMKRERWETDFPRKLV